MIVDVSKLSGKALDWAVGIANQWTDYPADSNEKGSIWHLNPKTTPRALAYVFWISSPTKSLMTHFQLFNHKVF